MKPTKAPPNKEHVTALIGKIRLTTYDENGLQKNERMVDVGVIQAFIPDAVRSWLLQTARKAEQPPKEG